jgi:hypothetical protein
MMSVEVTTTDNRRKVSAAVKEATRLGMDAAANVYQREVQRAHGDHYTSQMFRGTLSVRQSIRRTDPVQEREGWAVRVGTKLIEPLYWELGHHNLFTRKYERREIWKPTAIATRKGVQNAYARVVQRLMRAHK